MSSDAGPENPRRRRGGFLTASAVLLVIAGSTAVAAGVMQQDRAPSRPGALQAPTSPVPSPTSEPSPTAVVPSPQRAPVPVEISIPSIAVRSTLTTVGLNADGTLEVPQPGPDYDKAAWYDRSPRPGELGPSVIEGHVDGVNGPSVFYDLGDLQTGAAIDVGRQDGTVVTFIVDAVRVYPKDDFPTAEVYGNTERPELRVITCGGVFDSVTDSYADNVVVFAHMA